MQKNLNELTETVIELSELVADLTITVKILEAKSNGYQNFVMWQVMSEFPTLERNNELVIYIEVFNDNSIDLSTVVAMLK